METLHGLESLATTIFTSRAVARGSDCERLPRVIFEVMRRIMLVTFGVQLREMGHYIYQAPHESALPSITRQLPAERWREPRIA